MSPRGRAPRAPKVAPWVGRRKLVVAVDGPLAARWYFAEDWAKMTAAAEAMAPSRSPDHRDSVLDYVAVPNQLVDHPTEPAVGTALRYRPTRRRN